MVVYNEFIKLVNKFVIIDYLMEKEVYAMKYEDRIKKRKKTVEGQGSGLLKMMDEEKDCRDRVGQRSAVRRAMDRTAALVVSKNLEECIREEKQNCENSENVIKEAVDLLVRC